MENKVTSELEIHELNIDIDNEVSTCSEEKNASENEVVNNVDVREFSADIIINGRKSTRMNSLGYKIASKMFYFFI